jgi:hypothetical protein
MEPAQSSPEENNFQSLLVVRALAKLQGKVLQSSNNANIFLTTDPPEDISPVIEQPKPSLVNRLFPGIEPSTVYLGAGAILLAVFLRKSIG